MKPGIPKGTRDFGPQQMDRRNYILRTIQEVFELNAYRPIETPAMENLSTLTGKYGQEGDTLLFKVLNNGDYLQKADETALREKDSNKLLSSISKRGLRYDLTVPFARYVVMHQNDISFPFKRYQIQPVWRADRPQKGRYQEFYQCDVDVVGSSSLMYEAELLLIYDEIFSRLGLPVRIKINHRKILEGIAESVGAQEVFTPMTVVIDKLDKIGEEKVLEELVKAGLETDQASKVMEMLKISDLEVLQKRMNNPVGDQGCNEIREVLNLVKAVDHKNDIVFTTTLARGLNYYTGCIFEVEAIDGDIGSVGGGGRYDNLTAVFGLKDVSGVGMSLGAERIYDLMEARSLFPEEINKSVKLLLITFDEVTFQKGFELLAQLRINNVRADLYPSPAKLKKQMKYANDTGAEYVLLIGEEELNSGEYTLKNMAKGSQEKMTFTQILKFLKK